MEKKLKIGIVVSEIQVEYIRNIIKGVETAAESRNVSIVVLPVKFIGRDVFLAEETSYEYQYTTLLSLVRQLDLDGVIVEVSSVCSFIGGDREIAFTKIFEDIPHVFISYDSQKDCCVNLANKSGLLEGLEYMYEQGCRKFCMVGGTDKSKDAIERKEGFISFLESKNIPFNDNMYISGSFLRECNEKVSTLLNKNQDADAVVAANDDMAEAVYEELKKRDKMPGEDVSVIGYDDKYAASKMYPSLTTVRADSVKIGKCALKLLLQNISDGVVEKIVLPTKLIKRNSVVDKDSTKAGAEKGKFNEELKVCFHEDSMEKTLELNAEIDKFVAYLNVRPDDMDPSKLMKNTLSILDDILENCTIQTADVDKLVSLFENKYREEMNASINAEYSKFAQNMYLTVYRKIMYAVNGYYADVYQNNYDRNTNLRLFSRNIMNFEHGNDQSYGRMLDALKYLGIRNAFVYTLDKERMHLFEDSFTFPDKMFLKAVMKDSVVKVIPGVTQGIVLSKLISNYYLNWNGYKCLAMLPLFFGEFFYGILLCDMNYDSYINAELLVDQMSAAVKMKTLLKENENIQRQLEENLNLMRESNVELDTLSKSDALTNLHNRRGFFTYAEKFLEERKKAGKAAVIAYVDMNNLKIINDKYGHDDGDFSLETIGRLIKEFVGEKGIAGRIGGDEFAFIMEYNNTREVRGLIKKIYGLFEEFNRTSDKEYMVTVAAGAHSLLANDSTTLTEALNFADEKLYEEKRLRSKEVVKTKVISKRKGSGDISDS